MDLLEKQFVELLKIYEFLEKFSLKLPREYLTQLIEKLPVELLEDFPKEIIEVFPFPSNTHVIL